MLTISKSSRVGRYYNWLMEYFSGQGEYSRWANMSLCKFCQNLFWRTLLASVFFAIVAISLGTISFILLAPYINAFVKLDSFYVVMSIVIWAALTLIFSIAALSEWLDKRDYVEPKPSLVMEWLKAKKQKVCPRLNVID